MQSEEDGAFAQLLAFFVQASTSPASATEALTGHHQLCQLICQTVFEGILLDGDRSTQRFACPLG